jgi:hypothetical protein
MTQLNTADSVALAILSTSRRKPSYLAPIPMSLKKNLIAPNLGGTNVQFGASAAQWGSCIVKYIRSTPQRRQEFVRGELQRQKDHLAMTALPDEEAQLVSGEPLAGNETRRSSVFL